MDQGAGSRWVGIDVAKATLEVAIRPEPQIFRVDNDPAGWQQRVERVGPATVQGIVLEATGR